MWHLRERGHGSFSRMGELPQYVDSDKVLGIQGTKVKLGFEVDPDVPVQRSEVWGRIHGNGQAKSRTEGPAPTTD